MGGNPLLKLILTGLAAIAIGSCSPRLGNVAYSSPSIGLSETLDKKKPQKIDIGKIAESIEAKLNHPALKKFGWYVRKADYGSDKAVIIIPWIHGTREIPGLIDSEYYNKVYDIISEYVHSVGLEGMLYADKNPLYNPKYHGITNTELLRHIRQSKKSSFGVEDKDLYQVAILFGDISSLLHKPAPENQKEVQKKIRLLSNYIDAKEFPTYVEKWENPEKYEEFYKKMSQLYYKYAVDGRSEKAIEFALKHLDINTESARPNIVAIFYGLGHLEGLQESLSRARVSSLTISNSLTDTTSAMFRQSRINRLK